MFIHTTIANQDHTFMVQFSHPNSKSHRYSCCDVYLISDLYPNDLKFNWNSNSIQSFHSKALPTAKSKMLLVSSKVPTNSQDQFCYAIGRYLSLTYALRSIVNPFNDTHISFRAPIQPFPFQNHNYTDFFKQSTAKLQKPM